MGDTIVVGTDGSTTAQRAVAEAIRLAKAYDGDLHVVSAYEPMRNVRIQGAPDGAAKIWQPLPDHEVKTLLDTTVAAIRAAGVRVHPHGIDDDPASALLSVAEDVGADTIVVGSRGMHTARRFVLGSVPNTVSHKARCNVLIVATDGED